MCCRSAYLLHVRPLMALETKTLIKRDHLGRLGGRQLELDASPSRCIRLKSILRTEGCAACLAEIYSVPQWYL